MRVLRHIAVLIALLASVQVASAQNGAPQDEADLNVTEIIFEHVGDSYFWHIATFGGRNVELPLPVIVFSRASGAHCFLSSRLEDGAQWKGFRIADEGKYAGKVVEDGPGGPVRPLDISITKNVLSLLFASALIALLILSTSRWYRRHDALKEAPKGLAGLVEMIVSMVYNDIIRDAVGKDYRRYAPYLLTAFFFIFINNLLGIIPFFPGGANVTGNIAVTLVLALCTFFATNLFGNRHYWKDILWPDVPLFLKAPAPIMPLIETVGILTKPFSLMIRLFANIMAGHAMIIGVVCVIFITARMGAVINGSLTVIAVFFGFFMDCLECLVAFIQAYVFTMLSSVFIGLSRQEGESETAELKHQLK